MELAAAAPPFSLVAVTSTHGIPFVSPAAAAAASAIMPMSSLTAALGKLFDFFHYFLQHIFHLFYFGFKACYSFSLT
ncbi:hypothetical protein [Peribacillus sp. NPDC096448]|uniref:hypothetical protein n=1 Tax=Peribacillus sp. NPDC096448 TaxID=3364395 RepID=UPI0037F75797